MFTRRIPLLLLLFSSSLYRPTTASIGDRSPSFQTCLSTCTSQTCSPPPRLSLPLRLTFWSCPSDCAYGCMHNLTSLALSYGPPPPDGDRWDDEKLPGLPLGRVVQYYGKWPFVRFLGMQEPLAVLFSLMNLRWHLLGRRKVLSRLPNGFVLRDLYSMLPIVGVNTWLWSSVFHTRDLPWTEKFDYFSAAASVLFSLYVAIVRIFRLWDDASGDGDGGRGSKLGRSGAGGDRIDGSTKLMIRRTISIILLLVFLAHISYLSFGRFDYSYNMKFNVSLGLSHNLLWYIWSASSFLPSPSNTRGKSRHPSSWKPPLILTLLTLLTLLELLDFPPILWSLDAHALWHLSTVWLILPWYGFLVDDARWLVDSEEDGAGAGAGATGLGKAGKRSA